MSGEWLQWYGLIFVLPAAVSVLVLLLSGLSGHGGGHGHGGVGHDVGLHHAHGMGDLHGGHAHAGGGLHGGHAHGAAHDAAGSGHGHAQAHAHGHNSPSLEHEGLGLTQRTLAFFAFGRAPVTIVLGSFMLGWGLCGLTALTLLKPTLVFPAAFVPPALGAAIGGALVFAKVFGEIAAHLIPHEESFAVTLDDLVGLTATVVYTVSEAEGRVHVFDAFRTLHVEPARTAAGAEPIQKGVEVRIVGLDPAGAYVVVEPLRPAV
jgi:hypothetical protein